MKTRHVYWTITAFALNIIAATSDAQVTAAITDGSHDFAEGTLHGYTVQDSGHFLCNDPHVIGRYVSCAPKLLIEGVSYTAPRNSVDATTNGILAGYLVVANDGRIVCESPTVQLEFRGSASFVLCSE